MTTTTLELTNPLGELPRLTPHEEVVWLLQEDTERLDKLAAAMEAVAAATCGFVRAIKIGDLDAARRYDRVTRWNQQRVEVLSIPGGR